MLRRISIVAVAVALPLLTVLTPAANAQLRIVAHNVELGETPAASNWGDLVQGFGNQTINGIAVRPAIYALTELQIGEANTVKTYLNNVYGSQGGSYQVSEIDAGGERYAVAYDTSKVTYLASYTFDIGTRNSQLVRFRPVGYTSSAADLWVFNSHLKAFSGSANESTRLSEVNYLRTFAGYVAGADANIVFLGDFNFTSGASEPGYTQMLAAGDHQAFDPAQFTSGQYTYGADGLYSRIDFQLPTTELNDNEGVDLIGTAVGNYSYIAYGNNGPFSPIPSAVVNASDHLPVMADYQLPAMMQVDVTDEPTRVIVGADAELSVAVENVADVVAANGADELDYAITGDNAVTGADAGIDQALGGGQNHNIALDTATAGAKSGTLHVDSSSQAAENASYSQNVSYQVVDHANASFSSGADQNALHIDFGVITPGAGTQNAAGAISNLESTLGFTAGLDLDSIIETDPDDLFTLLLNAFVNLDAGSQMNFTAQFNPNLTPGNYSASYLLNLSDEDLPGAAAQQLTLTFDAQVIPEPATAVLLLTLSAAGLFARPRQRSQA